MQGGPRYVPGGPSIPGLPGAKDLPQPKSYLPNWALAGLLGVFVGGTYFYTIRSVGSEDVAAELERESARQAAQEKHNS